MSYRRPINNLTATITISAPSERLKGKRIIITGGGRGLGEAMAEKFIQDGDKTASYHPLNRLATS